MAALKPLTANLKRALARIDASKPKRSNPKARRKVIKHTGPKLHSEPAMRLVKVARTPIACAVCGCTQKHACLDGCAWDRRHPDICSRCMMKCPYTAVVYALGSYSQFLITGPGKSRKTSTSLPLGADPRLTEQDAKQIAAALNAAYALGSRLGDLVGKVT